jgi:hypothetical protein
VVADFVGVIRHHTIVHILASFNIYTRESWYHYCAINVPHGSISLPHQRRTPVCRGCATTELYLASVGMCVLFFSAYVQYTVTVPNSMF